MVECPTGKLAGFFRCGGLESAGRMSVDDFIAAQLQLIRDGDSNEYLPTLWVEAPTQVRVNVLTDECDEGELETVAREWASNLAHEHDYFLAFKVDETHLKVVTSVGTIAREQVVAIGSISY